MGLFDKILGKPNPDDYAKTVLNAVRSAGETRKVDYDKEEFRFLIRNDGSADAVFNLGNMYAEYCSVPKGERPAVIEKAVQTWIAIAKDQLPSEFEDAKPDILPVIRERATIDLHNLRQQLEGDQGLEWAHEVIGEHYVLGLVYDLPTSMRYLTPQNLEEWGVSFYEAKEVARANLEGLEFGGYAKIGDGAYNLVATDDYISSRMILPGLIESLEVVGDTVALIPQRRELMIAGSEDEMSLSILATLATEVMKQPRSTPPHPLRLEGDQWIPWLPDSGSSAYKPLKALQVQFLGGIYQQQQELLATLTRQQGDDLFVSSYSAIQPSDPDSTATIRSFTVWPESLSCLLPKADSICFVRATADGGPGDVLGTAAWEKVRSVMGEAMEDQQMYPERYRVSAFPSNEQLSRIGPVA